MVTLTGEQVLELAAEFQDKMEVYHSEHLPEDATQGQENDTVLDFAAQTLHLKRDDIENVAMALGAAAAMTDPRSAAVALLMLGFELRGRYEERVMTEGVGEAS